VARRRLNVYQSASEVEGVIRVGAPKNWEKRDVPFPTFLAEPIARRCKRKAPDGLVFDDGNGNGNYLRRPRTTHGAGSWFGLAIVAAGIERITPHDLRHTAASLAISSGANVKAVQRMLGHRAPR
jgi:integrase